MDVFGPFSTIFAFVSGFFLGERHKSRGKKKVLSIGRWVVGPWPYGPNDNTIGPNDNPIGPYITPI